MDSGRKSVFRSFALITQLGLHVMVPTAVCVAVGVLIDKRCGTYWVIPLLFLGMLAGGRNAYRLAMSAAKSGGGEEPGRPAPHTEEQPDEDDEDE